MNVDVAVSRALKAGVPLICCATPEPAATVDALRKAINSSKRVYSWDIARGYIALNEAAKKARAPSAESPMEFFTGLEALGPDTVVLVMNLSSMVEALGMPARQHIYNVRDVFKGVGSALIAVERSPNLPPDIAVDFYFVDVPLPDEAQLKSLVIDILNANSLTIPEDRIARAVDMLSGLPPFAAEQAFALALGKGGRIDFDLLWSIKCRTVEETPGVSIWRGRERFDQLGGLMNVKEYCLAKLRGRRRYGAVVFIDEIEKALAGATTGTGDTSGVSQGILQAILVYMQDMDVSGMMFIGHPGTGKSAIAKSLGNEAEIPTVILDFGALKDSLVGATERRVRNALKTITAISNGRPLFVATCNKIAMLPPELRRRFTGGTFFFDLPTEEERASIWDYYLRKYEIEDRKFPPDDGWTGAEIKACCEGAWERNQPLIKAAEYVVPVAVAAPEQIESLCREADGRYISASYPGFYTRNVQKVRKIAV